MAKVGVVGTTSWGTTLAVILARRGLDLRLLARTDDEASSLQEAGESQRPVSGVRFPPSLTVTTSSGEALSDADLVIIAVPSASLRGNVRRIRQSLCEQTVIVSGTKGLEVGTGRRMSEVLKDDLGPSLAAQVCVMSGPNLAGEIIQGKPASTVIASSNSEAARYAQAIITSPGFRVYTNNDIVGVELAGALKNIIALGAGICDGLNYGDNAKSAFMTRGLAEIVRLGVAAGANPMTFAGLAGIGDLITTCASKLSRNHQVGERLAGGETLDEIRSSMNNVAEGIDTTAAAMALARELKVEMPITQALHDVLFGGLALEQAVADLLQRSPGTE